MQQPYLENLDLRDLPKQEIYWLYRLIIIIAPDWTELARKRWKSAHIHRLQKEEANVNDGLKGSKSAEIEKNNARGSLHLFFAQPWHMSNSRTRLLTSEPIMKRHVGLV